jgi:hypothetical protein
MMDPTVSQAFAMHSNSRWIDLAHELIEDDSRCGRSGPVRPGGNSNDEF